MALERCPSQFWPKVLVPALGCLPPIAALGEKERVLHVALRDAREKQPALERALRSIAYEYVEIDWRDFERTYGSRAVATAVCKAAFQMEPTFIFMQLHRDVISPDDVLAIRRVSDLSCVVVNWDGDQYYEPYDLRRKWFVDLGKVCDLSLVPNVDDPSIYAELGVQHPGFLPAGVDSLQPERPAQNVPPVVFLANNYPHLAMFDRRRTVVETLSKRLGDKFGVYGQGWYGGKPYVRGKEMNAVYAACRAALSMSAHCDLSRCTSDRLFSALMAGAVVLVEEFPDCEGLGLASGINCLVWSTEAELFSHIDRVLESPYDIFVPMRGAACEMARALHSWDVRVLELLAMVRSVREARRVFA